MTDTDRMMAWLREAMDETEQAARKAAKLCGCHPPAPSWSFRDGDKPTDGRILVVDEPHPDLKRKIGRRWNGSYEGLRMAQHIVRHDPAAVLRRITADRQLLELHQDDGCRDCTICAKPSEETNELGYSFHDPLPYPCDVVRLLAEGYGWSDEDNETDES